MSSKKSKKRIKPDDKSINKRNERLKYIDDEDKELDELEKIISDSENKGSSDKKEDENDDFFASLDKDEQEIKTFSERKKKKNENKYDFTKITDFVKQNTKYAIWGSIISVLMIALVIALAVDAGNKGSSSTKTAKKTAGNKLIKNTNKEIEELVNTYFTSRVACDVDRLSGIMDSVENISVEALQNESKYIEGYENIECYTKKGLAQNEYVVYVYYENKILNIETLAPGAVILYVKKDAEKGVFRIHNGIRDTEISKYISELSEDEDIKQFNKDVDEKLKKACDNDADLKAFYEALISAPQPSADEPASDENITPEAETQPPQDVQPE